MTARIDVTDLVEYSQKTKTKFYINFLYILTKVMNSREDYRMGYLWQTEELVCYDVINPTQYVFHDDTETFTLVYTEYCADYEVFYSNALQDVEQAKKTRDYGLDLEHHPNWFDASCIPWLSYDSLHVELPDGYLFFAPIVNWGKYRRENGRLLMPVTVRLNHAIADGCFVCCSRKWNCLYSKSRKVRSCGQKPPGVSKASGDFCVVSFGRIFRVGVMAALSNKQ